MLVIVNKIVSKNGCSSRSNGTYRLDVKKKNKTIKKFIMIMIIKRENKTLREFLEKIRREGSFQKKYTDVLFKLSLVDITNAYKHFLSYPLGKLYF